ncbi:MAG: hypothetical protein OXI23_09060 [Gemmatimonadota bacterium]|nr:hypothetical protein [Gemmatimonadota bacterium]
MNAEEKRAMLKFCQHLFSTSNLIATDFDDFQLMEVMGRNFQQQLGGGGLHISFSVSWHAIGKTGEKAHEALEVILPRDDGKDQS